MSRPIDEYEAKQLIERAIDEKFGNLHSAASALRQMNLGKTGLIARMFEYIDSLDDRIQELENRLSELENKH
jgi:polyhydroxyalkanoate synthesis regulator phasin